MLYKADEPHVVRKGHSGAKVRHQEFPCSDGQPMTDKDINRFNMEYADQALRHFFGVENAYVSSNIFVYYDPLDDRKRVSPDALVVKGVSGHPRESWKVFNENARVPDVVFEYVAKSSRVRDKEHKRAIYQMLGVSEYYVFDPTGEYMQPPFRAFFLKQGLYVEQSVTDTIDSPALGLRIQVEGQWLRFYTQLGERLRDYDELTAEVREQREHARQQQERVREQEERARQLEEELRRLRSQQQRSAE